MRPITGILLELLVLAGFLGLSPLVPGGILRIFYLLLAQFLTTYLVHCPAHYLVGKSLGISFRALRVGRTTLAKALPPRLGALAQFAPILTLSADKKSLEDVPVARVKAMYLSGVVVSCSSAIIIATSVTFSGDIMLTSLGWTFALGYLAFDIVFSPKSGDVARARKFQRPR